DGHTDGIVATGWGWRSADIPVPRTHRRRRPTPRFLRRPRSARVRVWRSTLGPRRRCPQGLVRNGSSFLRWVGVLFEHGGQRGVRCFQKDVVFLKTAHTRICRLTGLCSTPVRRNLPSSVSG